MIWVGYTTLYRGGGPKFERAARTMADEKRAQDPDARVRLERVESKRDFVEAMKRVGREGETLSELHFIGHSGMYGPMFRTTSMPEQFSPFEWSQLSLPFAPGAEARFHACRTARWFAPHFARQFGVATYGYHGYTTISARPDAFRWEGLAKDAPLYVIACPGRKSHGLLGSLLKYGGAKAESMARFEPTEPEGDVTYDAVAALYDEAFSDISVRRDECRWIEAHLPADARVLDVGCGNGALLTSLQGRIASGVGVDSSDKMIERARARGRAHPKLAFETIEGPCLPFPDRSFDVIVSLLSFRYLDWDPMMNEMRRVLAPNGKILIVDMVTAPVALKEAGRLALSKARQVRGHLANPRFASALRKMVSDPSWKTMLRYNPIRSEHELKWYLESRFPGRTTELLNVGWNARVLAFDSGPLATGWVAPQSYP
jgi:ubiquinone/menaquinone biosynthesis C-methylase UbiE